MSRVGRPDTDNDPQNPLKIAANVDHVGSYNNGSIRLGASFCIRDVPVRSPRLSLLPTFRFHYVFDADRRLDGVVNRDVGSMIWRDGVGPGVLLW